MEGNKKYVRGVKRKPLVVDGHTFHPANHCELTEKELEKARLELGETEEKKTEYLQKLKDKLTGKSIMNFIGRAFNCAFKCLSYDTLLKYHTICSEKRSFLDVEKVLNYAVFSSQHLTVPCIRFSPNTYVRSHI